MTKCTVLLATIGLLAFAGCGGDEDKDPDPAGPGNTHDGTIHASLSGDYVLEFECENAYGLQAVQSNEGSGLMQIQGFVTHGSDTYMIDIQVYHDPASDTFAMEFPPVEGIASVAKNGTGNVSESGSVTFTQVSNSRMQGTFDFTAFRMVGVGQKVTVTVANGSFDVPVVLEP